MRTIVALDLETTGLDSERDAIIEIGAVRFHGARIEDEWSTLVNPGRPIPRFIADLTGIDDSMVAGAPRLAEVLGDLTGFVSDLPVLSHNVGFDIAFLNRKGALPYNQTLDTLDLAAVVLPAASRYSLRALADDMGIPAPVAHRALADAHTTRQLYLRLLERVEGLPPAVVEEIVRLGAEIEWGAGQAFEDALEALRSAAPAQAPAPVLDLSFRASPAVGEPLRPTAEPTSLDIEEIASLLEPGGPLARHFPTYEHRAQQISMLRAVTQSLSQGRHLLVEAGTGTGKSMAYLIPALAWASQNGRRVVISTNTINLQDQLFAKDVPDLRAALGADYRAAVLKGRANYLCPRRLDAMRRVGPRSAEEMRLLAKVLVWLAANGSGDRTQISLQSGPEAGLWARVSAESDDCSPETCVLYRKGACPYFQARAAAERAHVVIVNHALLLADIATGSRVIPEYEHLIVDEAHHLEAATTAGLSFEVNQREILGLLRDLDERSDGLLRQLRRAARRSLAPDASALADETAADLIAKTGDCRSLTDRLFASLSEFLSGRRDGRPLGPYDQEERIVPATRTLPDWSAVEMAWDDLRLPLGKVIAALASLADELPASEATDDLVLAMRTASRSLGQVYGNLDRMVFEPEAHMVYWVEADARSGAISLHAAPLDVGPLVEQHLWQAKDSVILTSATLTTAGSFDHIRRRLNATDAEELALGSPFDYETSTLLYLVNDISEPTDREPYQRAVERGIVALCKATRGRALVLFTSNDQLRSTARAIADPLAENGVQVLEQSEGASRHALLERFRSSKGAVLLGTRSYWEGIDVPGEALSVLVIARLPFDVPSDPIIAARSETYDSPFEEYTLPEAILRFRQGFGRLIRTRSDRGVVVTLDRRLLSKPYGRAFLESLPRCTVRAGRLVELPAAAARWLGE
jgi:DNA polymerase-3 subunit epsilon/ATP-dependent DNA helicase DinG